MKILKQEDPKDWTGFGTCNICKTEVEMDVDDLFYYEEEHYTPEATRYYSKCPVCNWHISPNDGVTSKIVQMYVDTKSKGRQ